jgi:hypothetical protein
VTKAPEVSFGKYKGVCVPDLAGSGQVPGEAKTNISDLVARGLTEQKLFARVDRADREAPDPVLLVKGQVIQYNPGSRGKRYVAGPLLGSGKGSVIVNVKFVEKQSGRELAECSFEGEIKGGVFGGGIDETYREVANEIVQFIKSNF